MRRSELSLTTNHENEERCLIGAFADMEIVREDVTIAPLLESDEVLVFLKDLHIVLSEQEAKQVTLKIEAALAKLSAANPRPGAAEGASEAPRRAKLSTWYADIAASRARIASWSNGKPDQVKPERPSTLEGAE